MKNVAKEKAKAEKIRKQIAERNRLFKTATRPEKRVLLAKDVIAQIKAKKIVPDVGRWVLVNELDNYEDPDEARKLGKQSAQKAILGADVQPCNCCALGGLFLSCTLFNNKTTVSELHNIGIGEEIDTGEKFKNGLDKIFSAQQLRLIEIGFEGRHGWSGDKLPSQLDVDDDGAYLSPSDQAALDFYEDNPNKSDRLVTIMKNIVANEGEFIP